MDFDEWVAASVKHNASDLHLCTGHYPVLRIAGDLHIFKHLTQVTPMWMENLAQQLLNEVHSLELQRNGQVDFSFSSSCGSRLRGHFFRQQCGLSAAFRLIASQCPTLVDLEVPEVVHQLLPCESGLILVTGATGSGKSTTLAGMIGSINQTGGRHIITLEDPVEFIHHSEGCLIQQRELGGHIASFGAGLKAALRQDPDIILLGELRDRETIALALTAAETGHLVLGTLHTRTAAQAVDRLVDVFPAEEKTSVRSQLANSLMAVIAQKLVRRRGGGQVAVFETMIQTAAVSHLIREGKTHQLPGIMQTGGAMGMQTFEQGLQQRQHQGLLPLAEDISQIHH
ncbi:type IV pilus twitching motility protein PilT [Yersinia ruckeri]|uniref:type IV pilus twitching motility protein PilT n=1 Tax=Yersinia ruckeri TaxID=29486 RepID=UPI0008FD6D71|nr:type IV pilus twitching motility protein PilT [Yersinia ruckeri]EKN4695796.1 type IV pilus twitching motility protein PilT [Yersinia ruckeri]ELM3740095.1 type IV pilus twitching motility protein PilT [Yersinia ruckeri]MCK8539287.1 type IV pilus twitching motility protein PilT [Yersinia ruckeri]MCK8542753.1 type IV pilus twitching motility protein PilT [Yersinia ruckeri]MCK8552218.1 type IV pilus twitching motility protein PilT [Yersinia ruckeri]